MRIKRKENTGFTLGRLGKIKAGKKNDKGLPTSTDYFVFTSNQSSRLALIDADFGDKPTSLPVTFHTDDYNSVCSERFEIRNSSGQLVAYGDGENFYKSEKDGYIDISKEEAGKLPSQLSAGGKSCKWDEVLILNVIILGFPELGTWEFRTKGKETSITQIRDSFDATLKHFGRVTMMPFRLTIHKVKSNRANANRRYPVVNLTCDLSIDMSEKVLSMGSSIQGLLTQEKLENKKSIKAPKEEIEDAVVVD